MTLPDPDKTRRRVGLALFLVGLAVGAVLLFVLFLIPPLFESDPVGSYLAMLLGAALAFPAMLMYLTVPRLLDRYDPEPWYALLGCLAWGAVAACGMAGAVNTVVLGVGEAAADSELANAVGSVLSAPFVEEAFKCLGVWGVAYFLKREFDGVVDGVIYATFTAIGFAAVENVVYYSQAVQEGADILAVTVVLRGVLGPWAHPVYTSMFGLALGISRETRSETVRTLAPFAGYAAAVLLHMVWNASTLVGEGVLFLLLLPLWLLFVLAFLILVAVLVRRRGRIIRENLVDEVLIGTLDEEDLELVCSAFGALRARARYGRTGAELVRVAARLALSKWHTARATETLNSTVSIGFIVPLRRRLAELRDRRNG